MGYRGYIERHNKEDFEKIKNVNNLDEYYELDTEPENLQIDNMQFFDECFEKFGHRVFKKEELSKQINEDNEFFVINRDAIPFLAKKIKENFLDNIMTIDNRLKIETENREKLSPSDDLLLSLKDTICGSLNTYLKRNEDTRSFDSYYDVDDFESVLKNDFYLINGHSFISVYYNLLYIYSNWDDSKYVYLLHAY